MFEVDGIGVSLTALYIYIYIYISLFMKFPVAPPESAILWGTCASLLVSLSAVNLLVAKLS
jgi:hypothetical protein